MANRSDFFSAKLPRQYKKMLALSEAFGGFNKAEAREHRKLFIKAHAAHVTAKTRRSDTPVEIGDAAEAV